MGFETKLTTRRWFPWLVLAAVCLVAFFAALGTIRLIDVDEPRYAEAAREMIAGGDWLTPHFNAVPRFDKPVLFYWLIALAFRIFGVGEFAARFWSAALAGGLVFLLYGAMRRDLGERAALAGGVILATSLQFLALARLAITDMALSAFLCGAAICFYRALTTEARSGRIWALSAHLLMGLAVLTKGPVGLVLPGAAAVLFVLVRRNFRADLRKLDLGWGVPVFLVVAVPWYVLMVLKHGEAFTDSFLLRHNVGRFLQVTSGHGGSPFYYIPVLLAGFLPWTPFLPQSLWRALRTAWGRAAVDSRERGAVVYWLLFGAVTFVFYSLSQSKLPTYITPLYLPLAVMTGLLWSRAMESQNRPDRGMRTAALVTAALLLIVAVGMPMVPLFLPHVKAAMDAKTGSAMNLGSGPIWLGMILLAAALVTFLFALHKRPLACFWVIACSSLLAVFVSVTLIAPAVDEVRHQRLGDLAKMAGTRAGPDDTIVSYGLKKTSVVFYSRRPVRDVDQGDLPLLKSLARGKGSMWVLSRIEYKPELKQVDGLTILSENPPYLLALKRAAPPSPNHGPGASAAGKR